MPTMLCCVRFVVAVGLTLAGPAWGETCRRMSGDDLLRLRTTGEPCSPFQCSMCSSKRWARRLPCKGKCQYSGATRSQVLYVCRYLTGNRVYVLLADVQEWVGLAFPARCSYCSMLLRSTPRSLKQHSRRGSNLQDHSWALPKQVNVPFRHAPSHLVPWS